MQHKPSKIWFTVAAIIAALLVIAAVIVYILLTGTGASSDSASLYHLPTTGTVARVCNPNRIGTNGQIVQGTAPWIQVTSPAGGEVYYSGQTVTIKWTSCNVSTVYIGLAEGGHDTGTLNQNPVPASTGSYSWTIPLGQATDNDYHVGITSGSVFGQSNMFTITSDISISATGTPKATVSAGTNQNHGAVAYTIPFSVTAGNQAIYLPASAKAVTMAGTTNKQLFCIDTTTPCSAVGNGYIQSTDAGSPLITAANNFKILPGQTKSFVLVLGYEPTQAMNTRATLLGINWSTSDLYGTTGWQIYTSGLDSAGFKTPFVSVQ